VSTTFVSLNLNDLPHLLGKPGDDSKEEKNFKIPGKFTLDKLIEYLYNEGGLRKYILSTSSDKENPIVHLELLLQTNLLAPEDGQPQMIVLDNSLTVLTVRNLLWRNIDPDQTKKLSLIYRRKQV